MIVQPVACSKNGINNWHLLKNPSCMLEHRGVGLFAIKKATMRYPPDGVLKSVFVTDVSQIVPGIVIRMGFPDLHNAHVKNYHFGVVSIVATRPDSFGNEIPAVIRVHWEDESFNDFCAFSSKDFSFDSLLCCVNDFAVFRNGSLKGVDALKWSLIRKLESFVQAARPCSATFRFSSPTRKTPPEIVMWHFAKNSSKNKLAKIISKKSSPSSLNLRNDQSKLPATQARQIIRSPEKRDKMSPNPHLFQAKESTVSFLYQVVSHVINMRKNQEEQGK